MIRNRKKVNSLYIDTASYQDALDEICRLIRVEESSYVCLCNVHMNIEAYDDKAYSDIVNGANLVTPDGTPIGRVMRPLYGHKQERVDGFRLLPDLLRFMEQTDLPIYFYGGSLKTLGFAERYIQKNYPGISKVWYYSPPFRALTDEEKEADIKRINDTGVRLLFVVLGCPKQEKWMAEHVGKINACMIGIGGAVPVVCGELPRAPVWMQKASLEWVFRWSLEPRRLFKRYTYTNSKFMYLMSIELIKRLFRERNPDT